MSAVTLLVLLYHEWTTDHPIIDLRVFKERSYATGVFLMTMLGFVLYGSMVLLPVMLQTLLGYPAIQAGIAMAPRGMGSLVMMPIVGFLTSKIDVRKLLAFGDKWLAGGDKPPRFICSDCQYTLRTRKTLGWLLAAVGMVVMLVTKEWRLW